MIAPANPAAACPTGPAPASSARLEPIALVTPDAVCIAGRSVKTLPIPRNTGDAACVASFPAAIPAPIPVVASIILERILSPAVTGRGNPMSVFISSRSSPRGFPCPVNDEYTLDPISVRRPAVAPTAAPGSAPTPPSVAPIPAPVAAPTVIGLIDALAVRPVSLAKASPTPCGRIAVPASE